MKNDSVLHVVSCSWTICQNKVENEKFHVVLNLLALDRSASKITEASLQNNFKFPIIFSQKNLVYLRYKLHIRTTLFSEGRCISINLRSRPKKHYTKIQIFRWSSRLLFKSQLYKQCIIKSTCARLLNKVSYKWEVVSCSQENNWKWNSQLLKNRYFDMKIYYYSNKWNIRIVSFYLSFHITRHH